MAKTSHDPTKVPTVRGRRGRPPQSAKQSTEAAPPAHNFAERRRLDAAARRREEGRELMEAVLNGASVVEVGRRKGNCYRTVRRMLSAFSQHSPEEYKELLRGVRGLLEELTFDDLLYWRSESMILRNRKATSEEKTVETADLKYLKMASSAYHEARRALIKLYGLASPGSLTYHRRQSAPLTTEELRERLRQNPEMAAAVAQLLEGLTLESVLPTNAAPA